MKFGSVWFLKRFKRNVKIDQNREKSWTSSGKNEILDDFGIFLLTHDIERKIYEDNENQVHFDVRSIATMLYSNLETGSKDKINLLRETDWIFRITKNELCFYNNKRQLRHQIVWKSYLEVALGCYSIWSTGRTRFFNKIQNQHSWIRFDMFALCFCSLLHIYVHTLV